jgi:hypothetical protein
LTRFFLVNLINHNLSGFEISAFFNFFGDFFEIINILEVEIGRSGPGILGVKFIFPVLSKELPRTEGQQGAKKEVCFAHIILLFHSFFTFFFCSWFYITSSM